MKKSFIYFSLFLGLVFSCKKNSESIDSPLFKKISSKDSGIDFSNILPKNDSLNILDYLYYYNGGGVGTGDINNDGLEDLFFVSNRGENKLYLNKGNLKFEDISTKAGIKGLSNWKTGVSFVDINADGFLDIYVNAVGKYKNIEGRNELYINNKNNTFTEKAEEFNLAFKGFSTQTTFFDYDKDGDLDCYILTHAVHSVSSYDRVSARALRDGEAGDYLMRNDKGKFKDVSASSGIYGAAMGYGLGIVATDINQDGWEDLYVANDFHEDDYYYINQKNGTFKESVKDNFRHLSKYSMGCDVADVNNDGYPDVFTTDMHPEDETTEKLSLGEDAYDIYMYKLQFGFYNQYSRNCLQISNKGKDFQDISMQAGVASTDWSWSPVLADFDNDGLKDLFVSNGIPKRPNNMDYIKFLSAGTDSSVLHSIPVFGKKVNDAKAIDKMPSGLNHNYIFKGTGGWAFEDKSKAWGFTEETVSNGAIRVDLDNDGDLDLVTNDLNATAGLYENQSNKVNKENHFLSLALKGEGQNSFGIGTKIFLKNGGQLQYQALQTVRGFLSSNSYKVNFGLGKASKIDTLVVIWPNDKMQILSNVKVDQILILNQSEARLDGKNFKISQESNPLLVEESVQSEITHKENDFIDFIREPLVPFLSSSRGPKYAFGDINGDGFEDFYQCSARFNAPILAFGKADGSFTMSNQFATETLYEDNDAQFFDIDNDKDLDLWVVSGGNEFYEGMAEAKDRIYVNDGKGNFTLKQNAFSDGPNPNKSCIAVSDYDADGDLDAFVGGHTYSSTYGRVPVSFLWQNDGKGNFKEVASPELKNAGMVTDAVWADLDNDKLPDLIVVGDWMGIKIFKNTKGKLEELDIELSEKKGFWDGITAHDFDQDGDLDLVIGNLGLNSKYIKQKDPKLRMYANDMDGNGMLEQLIGYEKNGDWYPAATRDDLSRMAPALINKRFPTFADYAGKTLEKLFNDQELKGPQSIKHEVNTFESVYIENLGNNKYALKALPKEVQVSKIFSSASIDIDLDGKNELLMGGNLYGVSTYQGRYDASYGHVLKFENKEWKIADVGLKLIGEIRDIKSVKIGGKNKIWVGRNNMSPQVFIIK